MSKMNETIQLINSAIIKSRELDLKTDLQARMTKIAESDEMEAFDAAGEFVNDALESEFKKL